MYVSTTEDRAAGYGLPKSEYRALYEIRDAQKPLPQSQLWMGRFSGVMAWSIRATPVVLAADRLPEPEFPDGYLMTIVLGQLVLQGVRITVSGLEATASTRQGMPQIWPDARVVGWPEGDPVDDNRYQEFALGRDLLVQEPHVSLRPWKPATELPASELVGGWVELPTICGKHIACYPSILINEEMNGRFYAFTLSCDCGIAYLIHTEADGAHCKAGGAPASIADRYDRMVGEQRMRASLTYCGE